MRVRFLLLCLVGSALLATGCADRSSAPEDDCLVTDVFEQASYDRADLLVAFDYASLDGREDQQEFVDVFATSFQAAHDNGLDLHVAVVSTNWDEVTERGRFRSVLARDGTTIRWASTDRGLVEEFELLFLQSSPPHLPKGRAQVYDALETYYASDHQGFMRDGAPLSVWVVTPMDDRSGRNPIDEGGFIDWLGDRNPTAPTSFSSLVDLDGSCHEGEVGAQYLRLTEAIGGLSHSVCQLDDPALPARLAEQLAHLENSFTLSRRPVDGIESAWLDDGSERVQLAVDYNFLLDHDTNSLRFLDAPPPGSTLTVTYCAQPD